MYPVLRLHDIKAGRLRVMQWGINNMDINITLLLAVIFVFVIAFVFSMFGQGGGSVYSPLLILLAYPVLLSTSAFVVTCSGVSSFIAHLSMAARPNWGIWVYCVVAVFLGSELGSRIMAEKLKPKGVRMIFGIVLWGVALFLFVHDVLLK